MSTKTKLSVSAIVIILLAGFIFTFIKTYSISNVVKLQDRQNEKAIDKLRDDWEKARQPKLDDIDFLKQAVEDKEKELRRLDESWERKINQQKFNFSASYIEEIEQDCRAGSPDCEERKKNIPPKETFVQTAEAADLIVDTNKMVDQQKIDAWFKSKYSPLNGYGYSFVKYGEQYKIDPVFAVCVTWADSQSGKMLTSPNNFGNVGNNDRGDRQGFKTPEEGIEAVFKVLNNKYLGNLTKIGHFSVGGRKIVKDAPVPQIYASSPDNWNRNVIGCMNEFYTGIDEHYNVRK